MVISRLSKPRSRSRLSVNGAWSHYEVAIWIRCGKRISVNPMFMMLKGIYCPTPISRNPSLSVVFNPGITMLPSYRTATTAASSTGSLPPPPYFETQSLVQQPPRTYCECEGIDEEVSSIPTSNAAT
ncbi:hypothetical protein Tcan_14457 [Toxocara canis]|nr:hypothetical protein Tcan_14457 [Toxocara canis]